MAIDFEVALATGYDMSRKTSELVDLIRLAKEGKVDGERLGDINLTTAQKQTLAADYAQVKAELQNLFQQLP